MSTPLVVRTSIGTEPAAADIFWYQGDNIGLVLEFTDDNDDPTDLSAFEFVAQYQSDLTGERVDMTVDKSDAANGVIVVTPPDRNDLPTSGRWDLRQVQNGDIFRTLAAGSATAHRTVSRLS